jgi:hypothetical protein
MKPVDAIQEVQVLPRAKPSQQPGSRTRWPEETKVRSRARRVVGVCIEPRKLFFSCGPTRDKRKRGCLILSEANGGQLHAPGTQYPRGERASRGGRHRGRRPDHDDTGIARELVRASSASCLANRGSKPRKHLDGSPPRDQSSRRQGPPLRRVEPLQNAETTGTRGRANNAKEPRMGVRQS